MRRPLIALAVGLVLVIAVAVLVTQRHRLRQMAVRDRPDATARRRCTDATAPPAAGQELVVEVDQVAGARSLPSSVTRNGTMDLHTIFTTAGLDVRVHPDPPISDPTGGNPFTIADLAELHHKYANHRPTDPAVWYVHVLLVTRNANGDLGIIPDEQTRETIGVFTNTASGPDEVLRTTAHEIGHALNLFHSDGDGLLSCCKEEDSTKTGFSIMNQTRCLDNAWDFRWSTRELKHLRGHPVDRVRPGGCPFGECVSGHRQRC